MHIEAEEFNNGYWRYFAVTDEGRILLRKKVNRFYAYAIKNKYPVGSGKGLSSYFTYAHTAKRLSYRVEEVFDVVKIQQNE